MLHLHRDAAPWLPRIIFAEVELFRLHLALAVLGISCVLGVLIVARIFVW